jgi:hypothetical protein
MQENDYFDHVQSTYDSPGLFMKKLGAMGSRYFFKPLTTLHP